MTRRLCALALLLVATSAGGWGQEAQSGLSIPVTISGIGRYNYNAADGSSGSGGFRALVSPSLQLGSHWFAYAVLGAQSESYLDYSIGSEKTVRFTPVEAYVGYKADLRAASLLIKAGRLASAFGRYPLEYDDAKTPLIEPPALYGANLRLRPDQVPCNLGDVLRQSYDEGIQFHCGGATAERYGLVPVALYGIPGVEAQLSWKRMDARLQITNSSPANPQSLLSGSQSAQWTAGGGYSVPGGLHVGVSGFRGAYLERAVAPFLPAGQRWNDFRATGIGVEAQWAGGPWSLEGEWQRFRFGVPGFVEGPRSQGAYVQAKRILSPRVFVAVRSSVLQPGGATDASGRTTSQIDARQETEELVVGYRINRMQLLKTGASYTIRNYWALGTRDWPTERRVGLEVQLVTSLSGLSKGFR
jgi:hypothetical protein